MCVCVWGGGGVIICRGGRSDNVWGVTMPGGGG